MEGSLVEAAKYSGGTYYICSMQPPPNSPEDCQVVLTAAEHAVNHGLPVYGEPKGKPNQKFEIRLVDGRNAWIIHLMGGKYSPGQGSFIISEHKGFVNNVPPTYFIVDRVPTEYGLVYHIRLESDPHLFLEVDGPGAQVKVAPKSGRPSQLWKFIRC